MRAAHHVHEPVSTAADAQSLADRAGVTICRDHVVVVSACIRYRRAVSRGARPDYLASGVSQFELGQPGLKGMLVQIDEPSTSSGPPRILPSVRCTPTQTDPDGFRSDFRLAFGIGAERASLVRPDGYVAWRSTEMPAEPVASLVDALVRAACTTGNAFERCRGNVSHADVRVQALLSRRALRFGLGKRRCRRPQSRTTFEETVSSDLRVGGRRCRPPTRVTLQSLGSLVHGFKVVSLQRVLLEASRVARL